MRTKIYQINSKRDVNHVKFDGLDLLERHQGSSAIDPSIYDEVFSAEIDETDLEQIYQRFNTIGHPLHRGHSLSVSDVVVNDNGAFFCDSIGFQPIAFDESQTQKPDNLMRVVYVEPHKAPYIAEIAHTLEAEQKAVGGLIEPIDNDDGTCLVGNEESKLRGMDGNRRIGDGTSIIAGPFFVCGDSGESFRSLTDEEVTRYKARVARIIDNAKYTGSDVYDPIIDEDIFEEAAAAKAARQRNQVINECEGIALMRDRIRCGVCGAPMVRHICSKRKVKESWTCANDVCGCRVRISDSDLLMKVTLLMNRIIENADLMVPKPKKRFKDSLTVQRLQGEIDDELAHDQPSEKLIVTRIREIASQLYQETNAKDQIAARIAQKRVTLMSPQAEFNTAYFTDLVENVVLEAPARVTLITKTDVHISEGEPDYGSQENTQEDGDAN